jgi:hypothetical protein
MLASGPYNHSLPPNVGNPYDISFIECPPHRRPEGPARLSSKHSNGIPEHCPRRENFARQHAHPRCVASGLLEGWAHIYWWSTKV